MINTFLSEEAQLLKREFEQFVQNTFVSASSEKNGIDKNCLRIIKQIAEAGYLGLNVPSNYGGKNVPLLHTVLLAETIASYEPGAAVYFAYHIALIELLKVYGSEQNKDIYLPKLAAGELIGTLAYLEMLTPIKAPRLLLKVRLLMAAKNW